LSGLARNTQAHLVRSQQAAIRGGLLLWCGRWRWQARFARDLAFGEIHHADHQCRLTSPDESNVQAWPRLLVDQQDKRSVIPIEMLDVVQWLAGTVREAGQLFGLAPFAVFKAERT